MNDFERRTLDCALRHIQSEVDAATLASMLLRLTKDLENSHPIWHWSEKTLLTALIKYERKTSSCPTFVDILLMLRQNLDEEFRQEPDWIEFAEDTTENFRSSTILALEMRLSPFMMDIAFLQAASA